MHPIDGTRHALFLRNDRNEWELPGGRLEPGEEPSQCLSREFREETGLRIRADRYICAGMLTILPPHVPEIAQISIAAFGCCLEEPANPNPTIELSSEHCGAGWIPLDNLPDRNDIPEIYKTAVFLWKRLSDRRINEP